MGRKRQKKNAAQIATLTAKLNALQNQFEIFLENSSVSQDPENHEKNLKKYIQEITRLKDEINRLSK